MLKRFLVATDGSEGAFAAAHLASRVAAPNGQIVLLHVVPGLTGTALAALDAVGLAVGGLQGGLSAEWMQRATRGGRELLERARKDLAYTTASTIDVTTELEVGRPATIIQDRFEHGSFDALAVGGRGHGLLRHALLGSVAAELLLHASKPILIGRADSVRKILVATDGSEPAIRAARAAGDIARELDASVSLISAVELPGEVSGPQRELIKTAIREHFHTAFDTARSAVEGTVTDEKLVFQEPIQAILNEAARSEADLIVCGRGDEASSALGRLGSVAYRIAMGASTSVLVVP